jgi:hypothetical protein
MGQFLGNSAEGCFEFVFTEFQKNQIVLHEPTLKIFTAVVDQNVVLGLGDLKNLQNVLFPIGELRVFLLEKLLANALECVDCFVSGI